MADSPFNVRKVYTVIDEVRTESGVSDEPPLRRVAVAAVIANPLAGSHGDDLSEMISWGVPLGAWLGELAVSALGAPVLSYGKGGIAGTAGEQEHVVALLTTAFGNALREAVGGGKAWIASSTKRAAPGAAITIPLAHKDALYVRDHYDALDVAVPDAPLPDELVIIAAVANRGRLLARCGGLAAGEIQGEDGLR